MHTVTTVSVTRRTLNRRYAHALRFAVGLHGTEKQARVQGPPPLEIEKQKKKKGHQGKF